MRVRVGGLQSLLIKLGITFSRERKFKSCRVVRRRRKSCHFDSSSEELSNIFSDSRITERAVDVPNETGHKHNLDNFHSLIEPPPDYEVRMKKV